MTLSSMTGFARGHGVCGSYAWAWEIKSVNGKGLDLRLRVPPGWDAIEVPVRARASEILARGSVQANLTVERSGAAPVVRVNAAVLDAVLLAIGQLAPRINAAPPTLDGLLALKGVMEISDTEEREEERRAHGPYRDMVELARRGFDSVGSVRSAAKARIVRDAARKAGVEVRTVILDVADEDQCRRVIDRLQPYGLVNNAGYGAVGAIEDVSDVVESILVKNS